LASDDERDDAADRVDFGGVEVGLDRDRLAAGGDGAPAGAGRSPPARRVRRRAPRRHVLAPAPALGAAWRPLSARPAAAARAPAATRSKEERGREEDRERMRRWMSIVMVGGRARRRRAAEFFRDGVEAPGMIRVAACDPANR
jgi:hypothetical protein